jgi:hypothetical protein
MGRGGRGGGERERERNVWEERKTERVRECGERACTTGVTTGVSAAWKGREGSELN